MHRLAFFAPLLLAACTTPSGDTAAEGETGAHKCVSEGAESFIGGPETASRGPPL